MTQFTELIFCVAIMDTLTNTREHTTMIKFTDKEKTVLKSLIAGLYAEPGFSDVTVSDLITDELNSNDIRGVLSSLTEKRVIWSDD